MNMLNVFKQWVYSYGFIGYCSMDYVLLYEGSFQVVVVGDYMIELVFDDGLWFVIDGNLVIDNDGSYGLQVKQGMVLLMCGCYCLWVEYFQDSNEVVLVLCVVVFGWVLCLWDVIKLLGCD